jgi:hypothetical protein
LVIPAKAKYRVFKPSIAKTLDVKMINVSSKIARIAGIESTAKIKSVNSITNNTMKSGEANILAFMLYKKLAAMRCFSEGVKLFE